MLKKPSQWNLIVGWEFLVSYIVYFLLVFNCIHWSISVAICALPFMAVESEISSALDCRVATCNCWSLSLTLTHWDWYQTQPLQIAAFNATGLGSWGHCSSVCCGNDCRCCWWKSCIGLQRSLSNPTHWNWHWTQPLWIAVLTATALDRCDHSSSIWSGNDCCFYWQKSCFWYQGR